MMAPFHVATDCTETARIAASRSTAGRAAMSVRSATTRTAAVRGALLAVLSPVALGVRLDI
ncbi:hypothetical protein Olsu_0286 [Olsenella uli DSM 7084]|uniref:Uncharacterized protein n=1 Tax=Olsenella uli (strain ATCC 49627 / DSM 7084 / CCUG 31166 / CIP 109912 / JCM 12494 / LMG 11480 / NCIMB 702895 / VPI D76D-27C) TaxID=633147 RepID=E1QYE6_OLSUV|nr:hypothetical protein Olsu_0286 [Olsenella uli DSM 7084]KRO11942.1 hypothetical protein IV77_GL001753 [Olsenella uli DSM 7084]